MPLIRLEKASLIYPGALAPALDGIDLSIEEGDYLAVVGANGSGKSSLLRLISALRCPSSGRLSISGAELTSDEARLSAAGRAARAKVGLVFQSPADQIVSSSVEEEVAFGPENLGLPRDEIERRVERSLAATGLSRERLGQTRFLSPGQQQRLAVAGALASDARCLAFDEATAMLDPEARLAVLELMDGLVASGRAVVHVTHDMSEAARASRVLVLKRGRLVFDGTPAELFAPFAADGLLEGLGVPDCVGVARELGLPPLPREGPGALASRIAALASGGSVASSPANAATPPEAGRLAFELSGVSHSYLRGTANEKLALRDVDMGLPEGRVVAFVGRTGSGKSTALQLLDGLVAPSSGSVRSLGLDLGSAGADIRGLRMRAPLAIQRPESALFERYAGDDVAFGPRNLGLSGAALVGRVKAAMESAGLDFSEYRDRLSRRLSGGEQRRLALAGVLAMGGEALLLDEPTSALDPASKASILDLLLGQSRSRGGGATVVMATHSMEEAARADLVAVFSEGELVALCDPETLFYDRLDPAWGLGRPFACELYLALVSLGAAPELPRGSRPLSTASLLALLRGEA